MNHDQIPPEMSQFLDAQSEKTFDLTEQLLATCRTSGVDERLQPAALVTAAAILAMRVGMSQVHLLTTLAGAWRIGSTFENLRNDFKNLRAQRAKKAAQS